MKGNRRRRVVAVSLVLAVGAGVVWALASLNATGDPVPVPAVGPGESGTFGFEFGGPPVSVGILAGGVVLLAAVVVLWRRLGGDGSDRAP